MTSHAVRRIVLGLLLGGSLAGCSGVPGIPSDWRLAACFANQPGVAIIETFQVNRVSDLFPRMKPRDRDRIGAGTDERPAFVVRLRGKLKIVQPPVGPIGGDSFEIDDPTCLIVLAPDGTFPEGETPLFLGPISGG